MAMVDTNQVLWVFQGVPGPRNEKGPVIFGQFNLIGLHALCPRARWEIFWCRHKKDMGYFGFERARCHKENIFLVFTIIYHSSLLSIHIHKIKLSIKS
ncbi:hypothetical protein CDAR_95751 [Caerostris darwini]|uniref:Uncharacterized protein n=1 Tax=Caerostris darwini TaxID=1538125 RepID=A0AAV4UQ50_9ARAC|nr:hypothetical protein CDAR_95751 [Caerostris darwini]